MYKAKLIETYNLTIKFINKLFPNIGIDEKFVAEAGVSSAQNIILFYMASGLCLAPITKFSLA